jgi:hypothetical protein
MKLSDDLNGIAEQRLCCDCIRDEFLADVIVQMDEEAECDYCSSRNTSRTRVGLNTGPASSR